MPSVLVLNMELEVKDVVAARKVQKADREKLRRDKLNEHFLELGCILDPDKSKNEKAVILADTIQVLKDLTAQVNRLKSEYASLSEESDELIQEKSELKEEKNLLKCEIDNLSMQYQQRLRFMSPWNIESSVLMGSSVFPLPFPVAVHASPFPMHFSFRPAHTSSYPTFVPHHSQQQSSQYNSSHLQTTMKTAEDRHHVSGRSSYRQNVACTDMVGDSIEVATDLELKISGLSHPFDPPIVEDQESSSGEKRSKQASLVKEGCTTEGSWYTQEGSYSSSSHAWFQRASSSTASADSGSITDV